MGLETHDICPDGPLAPDMVITVEPGVYLPEKAIGIRIEDDVLITKEGNRVLTASIPRRPNEIERAMAEARKARSGA